MAAVKRLASQDERSTDQACGCVAAWLVPVVMMVILYSCSGCLCVKFMFMYPVLHIKFIPVCQAAFYLQRCTTYKLTTNAQMHCIQTVYFFVCFHTIKIKK